MASAFLFFFNIKIFRIMKHNGLKTMLAAFVVMASLSACHCSANDNTSRPCVPGEHSEKVGNDAISQNFSPGSDCNPRNDMYDGIYGNLNPVPETPAGHDHHE
jgi:hypothetical protein